MICRGYYKDNISLYAYRTCGRGFWALHVEDRRILKRVRRFFKWCEDNGEKISRISMDGAETMKCEGYVFNNICFGKIYGMVYFSTREYGLYPRKIELNNGQTVNLHGRGVFTRCGIPNHYDDIVVEYMRYCRTRNGRAYSIKHENKDKRDYRREITEIAKLHSEAIRAVENIRKFNRYNYWLGVCDKEGISRFLENEKYVSFIIEKANEEEANYRSRLSREVDGGMATSFNTRQLRALGFVA